MSTYNPHHAHIQQTYSAVQQWVQSSLLGTASVLTGEANVWTSESLDQLDEYFVRNLDEGEGDFLTKLEAQLDGASASAIKLMAEINWIILLFASRISPATKRDTVTRIWSWSGSVQELNETLLSDEVLEGVGHAGVAFNTLRWKEVVAFINVMSAWKERPRDWQESKLGDPWAFLSWLGEKEEIHTRAIYQILPHLIFPETFERISSKKDKVAILVAFKGETRAVWNRRSQEEIDQALLGLRGELEEREGRPIDFYSPDMKAVWQPSPAVVADETDEEPSNTFAATLTAFLDAYGEGRTGPFTTVGAVSRTKTALQTWLQNSRPIASRDTIRVKISVGQGNWTRTPWIALLDDRVTTSTQRGFYIVFLMSDDLSVTYLTLNQGMTELVQRRGQRGAVEQMENFAADAREKVGALLEDRFALSNDIDLQSPTSASANYEVGTIAHKSYDTGSIPGDEEVLADLEELLTAYDKLIALQEGHSQDEQETAQPYSLNDALHELFLERAELEELLATWENKFNLILQGAPGVGKSFVSRRLAYCLLGEKAPERVRSVQFHQSYSYEDFVRGYRPSSDGGFSLQDGVFYEFCKQAADDPENRYVLLIDEINRGNLSKILGELMLLIEADKREAASEGQREWTARLAYSNPDEEEFWVPDNLFILGMMNTADRSLSLVDYALRRRFAFAEVPPKFSSAGFQGKLAQSGIPGELRKKIATRMEELNATIAADKNNLGPGFRIGHSFFVPRAPVHQPEVWYDRVVRTEIHPLLLEYWFDEPEKADQWREKLLAE